MDPEKPRPLLLLLLLLSIVRYPCSRVTQTRALERFIIQLYGQWPNCSQRRGFIIIIIFFFLGGGGSVIQGFTVEVIE